MAPCLKENYQCMLYGCSANLFVIVALIDVYTMKSKIENVSLSVIAFIVSVLYL